MIVLARFAIQEALKRRVFNVVAVLTVIFLVLYALGVWQAFKITGGFGDINVDEDTAVGSTMLGLAMFGTLFLGVVLAVFLTLGAIRGDAETGLLQPLIVRPIGRRDVLLARLLAAGGVSAAYVIAVYLGAWALTGIIGGWTPSRFFTPPLALAGAVIVITSLSLAGSVLLSASANGIATFMVFGAGLVSGLLGQIGNALNSHTLENVADVVAYALPFQALYEAGLGQLTAGTVGFTRFALELGPLGGARPGTAVLFVWPVAYVAGVTALAVAAFRRADL
ncbi:MAG: type transport system permease protein [Solirubrobacteraceae bacterium]|jgi:ABC-type transport system involved in multi-copper enzyme maturation permease subunit|nr:type transport system permease protein [Solirubrobacteraceae bacterium]